MDNREFVGKLRKLADFIEAHPDLKPPYISNFNIYVDDQAEMVAQAKAAEVKLDKDFTDHFLYLHLPKAETGFPLSIVIEREKVCGRNETQTWVEEKVIPAHYETKVEWSCPESLLDTDKKLSVELTQKEKRNAVTSI